MAIRQRHGFSWDARPEAVLRVSAGFVQCFLAVTPAAIRHWPQARAALRRARGTGLAA